MNAAEGIALRWLRTIREPQDARQVARATGLPLGATEDALRALMRAGLATRRPSPVRGEAPMWTERGGGHGAPMAAGDARTGATGEG